MRITKIQADEEGNIFISNCIAVTWVGMQRDIPTIICFQGDAEEGGKNLRFYVKMVGDDISIEELDMMATALVTADSEFILFSIKPQRITRSKSAAMPWS